MATSRNEKIQENFPSLFRTSDIETASVLESRELQGGFYHVTHKPSRRASTSGLFKIFFAVSVVSLALVYVMLSCFQHVPFVAKVKSATRSLAAGGSGGNFCPQWAEDGESAEAPGSEGQAEGGASDAGSPASAAGGLHAPGGDPRAPSSPSRSTAGGWGPQQMPPQWLGRITGLLVSIKGLTSSFASVLPFLDPSQAVELCEHLAVLAVIELSAMAYVPDILQPMRSEAAASFSWMIESVLSTDATREAAEGMRLEERLKSLKSIIGEVGRAPSQPEVFADYMTTITECWNLGTYAVTQTSALLESLLPDKQQQPASPQMVQKILKSIEAVCNTRKAQLLREPQLRRWLTTCQARVGLAIVYTDEELAKASLESAQQVALSTKDIDTALVTAGSTPVLSTLTTSSLGHDSPSHHPTILSPSTIDESILQPPAAQHHHPTLPAEVLVMPPPSVFGPPKLPHHPSGPDPPTTPAQTQTSDVNLQQELPPTAHPASPSHTAPSYRAPQPQQGSSPRWEQLGARPRQQAAESAQLRTGAQTWGYRRMPADWVARMEELLKLMQTAATDCRSLLPSLSPEDAVPLSMHLSMLMAVHVSVLAYLPEELEPLRQDVVASYKHLLDSALRTEPTKLAAESEAVAGKFASVRVLIERLDGVPREVRMDPLTYMRRMITQYRIARYTCLQALSFLGQLHSSQHTSGPGRARPRAIIPTLEKMSYVVKMHLLKDQLLRSWFVSQARSLIYPLCREKEIKSATSKIRLKAKQLLRRLVSIVRHSGLTPIDLEAGALPSDSESEPIETTAAEQPSAQTTDSSHEVSSHAQSAPSAMQPAPSLLPDSELPAVQPPLASASSLPPGAHPPSPAWSASPTPHFGVSQSPWSWSPANLQHGEPQHPQSGQFVAPNLFWGADSTGSLDGGLSSSMYDKQGQEGSDEAAAATGDLGLLDLAARLSQWDMSDSEKDEED
ncbi:hypothetical protein Emed_001379 [Eimeria media]